MNKELAIYNELRAAAERVFNEGIQAPIGTYTLKDLSNIGKKNAPDGIYFRSDYNENDIIKISVDGFECEFYAAFVFALAYRFENLAKVNKKDCAKFTREAEIGEPVAVFTLDATTCDSLSACENPRNSMRPVMTCVFMDLAAGLAVCSNGHVINVTRIKDVRIIDSSILNFDLLIPRDFAKSAKGCEVTVYKNGNDLFAVASNVKSCALVYGTYPDYKAVLTESAKNETAPAHLVKNSRDFKKAAASIAKLTKCEYVFISGMNGDEYITLSAMGDGGEVTRRVALSSCLTFTFATAVKPEDIKIINNAADTLYISSAYTMMFAGANVAGLTQAYYQSDMATPTAEAAKNIATQLTEVYNVYQDFIKPAEPVATVAPADSIQAEEDIDNADTLNIATAVPADSIQAEEDIDNADTLNIATAATADSIQAEEDIDNADTLNIATVAPADSTQSEEGIDNADTLNIATVAPADSIQEEEGIDNADTLNIATVAPADSIQEEEGIDNADTLNIATASPADSIQEEEGIDNADTLNIATASPADSIEAEEDIDNAYTLNIATASPADSIQSEEDIDNAYTLNIATASPADSIQSEEDIDNADTVKLRRLMFVCLRVAAVILFVLFVRIISTNSSNADTLNIATAVPADSIQAEEDIDNADTLNIATAATADSIQAEEDIDNADTLNIATAVPADSIQAEEDIDNADTLNIATAATADSIQAEEDIDNADTLNIATAVPADSIQAEEDIDNADTLNIATAATADSIQAEEDIDNADTLNIATVAPADSIQSEEGIDNADTLNIATASPADSIEAEEDIDNAYTLNIATVAPADSIQAEEGIDNADTLNIAPAAHAQNLYIIGH